MAKWARISEPAARSPTGTATTPLPVRFDRHAIAACNLAHDVELLRREQPATFQGPVEDTVEVAALAFGIQAVRQFDLQCVRSKKPGELLAYGASLESNKISANKVYVLVTV